LRKHLEARIDLCVTKDEKLAVLEAHRDVASREMALDLNDLSGRRDVVAALENAKQFLDECQAKINGLTGIP
jgi:hypothetical protein